MSIEKEGNCLPQFTVEFFEKDNGECPVEEFLNSLDVKMKARVYKFIDLLEQKGNELRLPYSEHLSDGIYELRAKVGSDISRVLYFFFVGRRIIMTNGFVKKTQKTPASELALAKRYRQQFLSRLEENR